MMHKNQENSVTNGISTNKGGSVMNTKINSIQEFAGVVKEAVETSIGNGVDVEVQEILKNNDTRFTSLTIRSEEVNVAPTIYLDRSYEAYLRGEEDVESVVDSVLDIYRENQVDCPFDTDGLMDYEGIKDRICVKLVNAARNKQYLEDRPYVTVCDDLAAVFMVVLSVDEDGIASITVNDDMLSTWGVSAGELYNLATENTKRLLPGRIMSMSSVLMKFFTDELDENEYLDMPIPDEPLYVCSNQYGVQGAAVVLYDGFLKEFADKADSDLFVIPSSIHETILVPMVDQMLDADEIKGMVREINADHVAENEVLSDNVYVYRRDSDQICLAS